MNMLIIQHNDVENPGSILEWAQNHNYEVTILRPDQNDSLLKWRNDQIDMLVILDGESDPNDMSINWLFDERDLIQRVHKANLPILGIGLGAEQISLAFGGVVSNDLVKEIGWHSVDKDQNNPFDISDSIDVLNWHRDSLTLPANSHKLFSNQYDQRQGFQLGDNVIGIQFHLEMDSEMINRLLQAEPKFIENSDAPNAAQQSAEQIKEHAVPKEDTKVLHQILKQIS